MKPKNLCLVATVMALSMVTGLLTSSGTAHAQPPLVPHYECYNIAPISQPPILPQYLTLETQFGIEDVTHSPTYTDLCLPAQKKVGTNWVGSLDPIIVPHVECLLITGRLALKVVNLETQWGIQKDVVVGSPIEACMPAAKSLTGPPPLPPAVPHYECYNIHASRPPGAPAMVTLRDQFDVSPEGHVVEVGDPTRLCLAAIKNGHGALNVPDVECFAIAGAPVVGKYPYLLTQFPPYQEVLVVGSPRELCMPVLKTVVTGVGGIQNLPDIAESAAAAESSGGSSSLPYAAIAGAAVGLVVVLGAGGWYARRRWLS